MFEFDVFGTAVEKKQKWTENPISLVKLDIFFIYVQMQCDRNMNKKWTFTFHLGYNPFISVLRKFVVIVTFWSNFKIGSHALWIQCTESPYASA